LFKHSLSVSILIVFIYINSLVWLAFGLIIVFDAHPSLPDLPLIKIGMAFLAFIIAGILVVLGFLITKQSRIAFFLTSGLLLITALLSIFDDFGLADLAFLILNLVPLVLLFKDRGWYLQTKSHPLVGNPK